MNEARAVAILMANLNGARNKPSMVSDIALACRTLKMHPEWGIAKMSRYFGVAKTTLKELDRICDLEPEFLAMADQKKIGISAAYQLVRVDRTRRAEAAALFPSMSRQEIRDLVFYIMKYPDISVQEAKRKANELVPQTVNVLALPISNDLKERLEKNSSKSGLSLHDYATAILENHG